MNEMGLRQEAGTWHRLPLLWARAGSGAITRVSTAKAGGVRPAGFERRSTLSMGFDEALTTKPCYRNDAYPHRGGDFP